MPNLEVATRKRLGKYSGNIAEMISFYEESSTLKGEEVLVCPRGFAEDAYRMIKGFGKVDVIDQRLTPARSPLHLHRQAKTISGRGNTEAVATQ